MNAISFSEVEKEFPDAVGEEGWRILSGDCREILPRLPEKSVDLVFADPPYNLQLKNELYRPNMTRVDGVDDAWDRFDSPAAYDSFCESWLGECRRILKDDGAIWVIGSYHNIFRLGRLMMDLGFWILNDIVWHKSNPMPNFRGVRFTNATETLIWAKKSESARYFFNHAAMKKINEDKQMTNVWRIPLCGGKERLRDSQGRKLHSTQKPQELLRRVILSTTRPGEIVLDPFLGSGTTLAVAYKLGRRGIGIEQEDEYVRLSEKRLSVVHPELDAYDVAELNKPRRISMKELMEKGYLKPGQLLYPKSGSIRDRSAKLLISGNLKFDDFEGSIHRVGAHLENAPSCNGWRYWFFKEGKEFFLLHLLREKIWTEEYRQ